MLELKAASFYGVTSALQHFGHIVERPKNTKEAPDGGLVITFENDPVLTRHLKKEIEELQDNLKTLGARLAQISASKLMQEVADSRGFTWEGVRERWDEIHFRLIDELTLTKILVLEPKEQEYFEPTEPLFGADFPAKFPTDGAFELDEAAKCLALGRPTASVFHMMRLMEIGIRSLARCLGIPDPVKPAERNWGSILKRLSNEIETRWPAPGDRMAGDGHLFDALHASLDAVKNPWRNATMHVENKYTDDEAEHIFVAVKGFMKRLASRCDEDGEPKA